QAERIERLADEQRRISARYRTLAKVGSQILLVMSAQGEITEPSAGWAAITGQPDDAILGTGWREAVHPDDLEPLREEWERVVREKPKVWGATFRIRTAEGDYRHFRSTVVPIHDGDTVVEWIAILAEVEDEIAELRREQHLQRAAAATSGIVGLDEMLTALARVIVPAVTDTCRVYVPREGMTRAGDETVALDRVTTEFRPGLPSFMDRIHERRDRSTMLGRAILERQPSVVRFEPGHPPPEAGPDDVQSWLRAASANSLACIPIVVDGTVAAAASVATCEGRPPINDAGIALISDIFDHAHNALSGAIAFRRSRQIAMAMQHSLLTDPPDAPGLEIAARYQPTSSVAEVGGDWYDSFVLPDRTTVVTIGDVVGHDLPAAVAMGQVRTILRGLAVEADASVGEVLGRLNTAMATLYPDTTATCAIARVLWADDGNERVLAYTAAGHPPALLVGADGTARFLGAGRNQLLGASESVVFDEGEERLPPASTVLFYTDGLIEERGEDIEVGLNRLRDKAASLAGEPVDLFCDNLLADFRLTRQDDVAMIAVRVRR
ncbi:MAG TPA: SpoIIE family protein phosphatase, partial [Actinopolymorphaceae bacterium]